MYLNVHTFVLLTQFLVYSRPLYIRRGYFEFIRLRSKCLPCLLYASEARPLLSRDEHSFDLTLKRTIMKIFRARCSVVTECPGFFNFSRITY